MFFSFALKCEAWKNRAQITNQVEHIFVLFRFFVSCLIELGFNINGMNRQEFLWWKYIVKAKKEIRVIRLRLVQASLNLNKRYRIKVAEIK